MKSIEGVGLAEVVSLYGGVQNDFFQLVFGQQIHIGGMKASMELAERAGIGRGQMESICAAATAPECASSCAFERLPR